MALFTAGQKLRAADLNDALDTPLFKVLRTGDLSVSDGNTSSFIAWQEASVDSDGMWNPGSPEEVSVQTAGVWLLVLALRFARTGGNKGAYLTLNGTDISSDSIVAATSGPGTSILQATGVVSLAEGDVLRGLAFQQDGSAMDLQTDYGGTYMTGAWLGELA